MAKHDTTLIAARDILAALGLLTRLPVPVDTEQAVTRGAAAAWAYPLAGVVVGAISAGVGAIALWCALPVPVAAACVLASSIIVTGAMHEDGLADSADGLWGGWDKERRLAIMKDSHIGTYGVLALVLGTLVRWSALGDILGSGHFIAPLIASAALSRAPMVAVMALMTNARGAGLSAGVGRPSRKHAGIALALGAGISGLALGAPALLLTLCVLSAACGMALIAQAKIGGQTGDILGSVQQVSEIAALAALAALI
ncbi:adenosylcobinamide-GDP ribazoletransferase [Pseudogemmobacter sp. W21_MBD1_M6]|uniref:adenosylcobinamide-GDP ribazoletransferase n=1 Tax=Pseudogemmobacter sp. W21_MBD1_M6 TaxID=3240271 RepID=UPI003F981F14